MNTLSQQLLEDKNNGLSETQVAEKHNLTTSEVRTLLVTARIERHTSLTARIKLMKDVGYSNIEIADVLELTESEVRILLKGE
jgi:orotate phosphoribosyltransferase-like protein